MQNLINWYYSFSSQPHRPFFTGGSVFFLLFMFGLWGIYNGLLSINGDILNFHAYPMMFIIFIQFFFGFVYTTFPKFLARPPIDSKVFIFHFSLYFIGSTLYFVSNFLFKELAFFSSLILLLAQILCFLQLLSIYRKSNVAVVGKYDPKWMLTAFGFGIFSHILQIISSFSFPYKNLVSKLGLYSGFYLFLFLLIFAVSQRMIPFFTSMRIPGYERNKSKWLMEIVFILLFLKVICLVFFNSHLLRLIIDLSLAVFFIYEIFFKWKLPYRSSFSLPILFVLHFSLIWIPVGFLLSSVESLSYIFQKGIIFEKSALHTLAVGYFLTILVGFCTRVILGHSGRAPQADKIVTSIFLLLQVILFFRIFASFSINFSLDYSYWIQFSALLSIIIFFSWFLKHFNILCRGR